MPVQLQLCEAAAELEIKMIFAWGTLLTGSLGPEADRLLLASEVL